MEEREKGITEELNKGTQRKVRERCNGRKESCNERDEYRQEAVMNNR